MTNSGIDIQKVGTSALVGAAGGAALTGALGILGAIVGGIVGATITGYSEYRREDSGQSDRENTTKEPSNKEQLHTH